MIRYAMVFIFLIVLAIFGTSAFLQPNDLINCGKSPDSRPGCHSVDAIVAVSGGDTDARVNWAVGLYKNGWAKKVIFSGAALDSSGPSNAKAMKRIAVNMGVEPENIIAEEVATTTKENAERVSPILKDNNMKSIILVTSGYHQRRTYLEFSKYNSGVSILNSPALIDKDWSTSWWTSTNGWWFAASELLKITGYYLFGL